MAATRDVTMAARVPFDLRADAEKLVEKRKAAGELEFDLSHVIRIGVRELVDRELHGKPPEVARQDPPGANLLARQGEEGAARRHDRSSSKRAAADVAPRLGSQRFKALLTIASAGDRGCTTDELIAELQRVEAAGGHIAPAVNGIARRVTDLLEVGAIAPLERMAQPETPVHVGAHGGATARQLAANETLQDDGTITRLTRHQSPAIVWAATPKGLAWLREMDV